jgi:hypothetical protein
MLEEPSMATLLEGLLPRLFPGLVYNQHFLCVPHEGKTDLEKSLRIKLRAWREPGVRFVVLRDNDGGDCQNLKARLSHLCAESGRADTLVRIVCQELEAWYIGDLEALALAFGHPEAKSSAQVKKFTNPDAILKPSNEVHRLIPEFQKVSGARLMSQNLQADRNRSASFNAFLSGLGRIVHQMGHIQATA